jgi:predicted GTPase
MVEQVRQTITRHNPTADIVLANSAITADDPRQIEGKRVLVVEDGPTLTHGEMAYGAGTIAARRFGAADMIDPRPFLTGSLRETFTDYPGIGSLLPAMGYSRRQVEDLEATINATECDLVIAATPIDLTHLVRIERPVVRIRYEYEDHGSPTLKSALMRRLNMMSPTPGSTS